ncbi:MAG: DUF5702 domain-containing protein [Ruminococcus sp.]|nr:DUF5702 domain-containing protein [Ruminococcus sp.]
MAMKKQKLKGSITVFSLIVLTAYIVFITSLLDLYRFSGAGAGFRAAVTTSVRSLRQSIDTYALKRYGFGFSKLDEKELAVKANTLIKGFVSESCADIRPVSVNIETQHLVSASNFSTDKLEDRIIAVCSETVSKSELDSVADTLDSFGAMKNTLKSNYTKLRSAIESADVPELNSASTFDFLKKCIPADNTYIASEQQYPARTSARSSAVWNSQDWAFQQPKKYERTLLESCKSGLVYLNDSVCSKVWFRSSNTVFSHKAGTGFENGLYSSAGYLDKYFQTLLNGQNCEQRAAEYEYVLFGHRSNFDNKLYAAERIFGIRFACDLCSLADDLGKNAETDSKAIRKAVSEAKLDTAMILSGKSLKLIKSKNEFKTSNETADSNILSLAQTTPSVSDTDYQAYLRFMLFHSISFEMMYARIADVVGFDIGKPLYNAVTDIKVTAGSKYNITNVSLVGMMMKGKAASSQAEISF